MRVISAIALCSVGTWAAAQPGQVRAPLQELLDRGFEVAAEGVLPEFVECRRWTLRMIPARSEEPCLGKITYGSFKRLKNDGNEFVCVSFREWACYPAHGSN